jgi:MFS transporter, SP family, general alpha glucoside:H+ symporter
MPHVGRRSLFLWGLAFMTLIMLLIGGLGVAQRSPNTADGLSWGIGTLLLLSLFVSNIAVGPVSYALVSELPSSLLRSKSVVIARFCYATINIVANVITPYQLNPSAWGWGAISGFFWAGSCALGWLFTWFCIPEPRGRTVAELDLLFERKVSARKFSKTEVQLMEMVDEKGTNSRG